MANKKCFTPTESTPYIESLRKVGRRAFTLAEVLITLAIIGVVAALTIPTLITKMSERAANARRDTIETRLLDGINRYSVMEDGLSKPYETTYDFLVGLSKYYKMSQICRADEITKCIPYDKIYSGVNDDSIEVSSLTTINKFVSGNTVNDYLPPASFITAQGTPVVMAFKKDCAWDMGKAMRSVEDSGCIAYMYDESGTRLPNKLGNDWIQHGLTINGLPVAVLGGVKIMTNNFTISNGLSLSQCQEEMAKAEEYKAINSDIYVKSCANLSTSGGDRWAYAMKYCKEQGWHLPTEQQLADIANAMYIGMNTSPSDTLEERAYAGKDSNDNYYRIGSKTPVPTALSGLSSSWFFLWAGTENSFTSAFRRDLRSTYSYRDIANRYYDHVKAVCVLD